MSYNRTEEAKALLAEIEAYCDRTKMRETAIGHGLFRHPGFVGLLRLRLTVSEEKEAIVRDFMRRWPKGYHGELPKTHGNGTKPLRSAKIRLVRGPLPEQRQSPKLSDAEIASRRSDRDPCPRCGIRADVGCKHSRAPIGIVFG